MQNALARQFKDDVGIQLASVSQAYEDGEVDQALDILSPMLNASEQAQDLLMVELMLMISKGQLDDVMTRCETEQLPDSYKNLVRARVWLKKGEPDRAEEFFQKAMDKTNGFYGYLDYARFLVQENRLDEAERLYVELLGADPAHVVAMQGMAIIFELRGEPDRAIQQLKKIIRISPGDAYSQIRLAKVYLQQGEARPALMQVNKVLVRDPKKHQ